MAITPPAVIDPPVRKPLKYGLFSAVEWSTTGRWQSGVTWSGLPCGPVLGRGGADCDPESSIGLPKDFTDMVPSVSAGDPFAVYGGYLCKATGNPFAYAQEQATAHLIAGEQRRVEQAFWSGDLGNQPNLQNFDGTTGIILSGRPQSIAAGIAYLEYEIGTIYGSQGVIHMTRGMALQALGLQILETVGDGLFTKLGTPVVAGTGYSGEGPDGQPATGGGQSWAFATPLLAGWRGEVITSSNGAGDLLDKTNNDLYAIAEREYVLAFEECGIAAVLLDQNICCGGEG